MERPGKRFLGVPSLYLHIPFCATRCSYCDFYTTANRQERTGAYLGALGEELSMRGPLAPRTIYVGGGTPTALPEALLERLLGIVRSRVDLSALEEWTVEMNPVTRTERKLEILREGGVTRLSIGVQSFDPAGLSVLERAHTADEARGTVRRARALGFPSVSLDLMFGYPGQTGEAWRADLEEAVSLGPDHLSAYSLIVEEETPMARRVASGRLALPPPEAVADRYLATIDFLEARGYARYETSNFARPGRECLHNVLCWEYREYEAAGASACAFVAGERRQNVRDLDGYIEALRAGRDPAAFWERPEGAARRGERAMLSLRLARGLDLEAFEREEGIPFEAAFAEPLDPLLSEGLLDRSNGRLRVSRRGLPVLDSILLGFVAAPAVSP